MFKIQSPCSFSENSYVAHFYQSPAQYWALVKPKDIAVPKVVFLLSHVGKQDTQIWMVLLSFTLLNFSLKHLGFT